MPLFLMRVCLQQPFHTPEVAPHIDVQPRTRSLLRSEEQRLNSSHQIISYAVFCLKKKQLEVLAHLRFQDALNAAAHSGGGLVSDIRRDKRQHPHPSPVTMQNGTPPVHLAIDA